MAKVEIVKPLDLFGREKWERLTARNPLLGPLLIVHCWLLILAAAAMFIIWPNPVTYILAVMAIGARQLGLAILMHDAAHGLLSNNKKLNDILGGMLSGSPVGANLIPYRNYHLQHHKFAQQEEDPDLVLSSPFPVSNDSMKRKIIRDLTGQTFFKQRIAPLFSKEDRPAFNGSSKKFYVSNIVLFSLCALTGYWWAYFALWIVPLATWNPLVTRLRNIAEHACVKTTTDPWRVARTTLANPVERLLIAPYWVNYHCEHHLFMYVPCYRLRGVHKALKAEGHLDKMILSIGYRPVLSEAASA